VVVAIVLAIGLSLFQACRPGSTFVNLPPRGEGPWIAFGDSLTAGVGASEGNDYPSLLSKQLGFPILNLGSPGNTTQDALNRTGQVVDLHPCVVLLCFGGNDTLQGMPHDQIFQNLPRQQNLWVASGSGSLPKL
jgi:acyl-CoA thioesterase I